MTQINVKPKAEAITLIMEQGEEFLRPLVQEVLEAKIGGGAEGGNH